MNWGTRLDRERQRLGWTKKALAERAGVPYDSVLKYLTGNVNNPRGDEVARLARAVELTETKLRGDSRGTGNVSEVAAQNLALISFIAAGKLTPVSDPYELGDGESFIISDKSLGPRAFALRIEGDSMSPRFKHGDVIICDPDAAIAPGHFVIAKADGDESATFKKYRPRGLDKKGNEIFDLVPLNEDHSTITSDASRPIRLIARVVRRIEVL